ncbi:esterase/lipase family protein [Algibacillus agarilyticus]|uniref:esterase/lipase family protein n=1 Tax=Algibacillus agarilyticus TaxID=2234133 RepID=UPI000DD094F3|nr:alpha/beta hydrolase [Algibacillus agarilyticus]
MTKKITILLHGLARSAISLLPMELALKQAGLQVKNIGYPSTDFCIDDLTHNHLYPALLPYIKEGYAFDFVCHSMGGILVRNLMYIYPEIDVGRAVMLSPPNHGSEIVDTLSSWSLFEFFNGPAGQELSTNPNSKPNCLGPVNFEVGVITGELSLNPIFVHFFNGPNDGKVSVESAKLEGMKDFLVVKASHTFIMNNLKVIDNTLHFLKKGHFNKRR